MFSRGMPGLTQAGWGHLGELTSPGAPEQGPERLEGASARTEAQGRAHGLGAELCPLATYQPRGRGQDTCPPSFPRYIT